MTALPFGAPCEVTDIGAVQLAALWDCDTEGFKLEEVFTDTELR
jgi:hypothetical protein